MQKRFEAFLHYKKLQNIRVSQRSLIFCDDKSRSCLNSRRWRVLWQSEWKAISEICKSCGSASISILGAEGLSVWLSGPELWHRSGWALFCSSSVFQSVLELQVEFVLHWAAALCYYRFLQGSADLRNHQCSMDATLLIQIINSMSYPRIILQI